MHPRIPESYAYLSLRSTSTCVRSPDVYIIPQTGSRNLVKGKCILIFQSGCFVLDWPPPCLRIFCGQDQLVKMTRVNLCGSNYLTSWVRCWQSCCIRTHSSLDFIHVELSFLISFLNFDFFCWLQLAFSPKLFCYSVLFTNNIQFLFRNTRKCLDDELTFGYTGLLDTVGTVVHSFPVSRDEVR